MYRLLESPTQHLEIIHGTIEDFELSNDGGLWLYIKLRKSNKPLETDAFYINLTDRYDYGRFIASVGTFCPISEDLILDINALIDKKIILIYLIGYGYRGEYRNFHSLVILEEMIKYSYIQDEETEENER